MWRRKKHPFRSNDNLVRASKVHMFIHVLYLLYLYAAKSIGCSRCMPNENLSAVLYYFVDVFLRKCSSKRQCHEIVLHFLFLESNRPVYCIGSWLTVKNSFAIYFRKCNFLTVHCKCTVYIQRWLLYFANIFAKTKLTTKSF